ncbi:MAG: YtxH domain-containing protein [Deltaproteobacteria bacterium]|nr:MAG: YtxH domain-containing protein [Deltaproteobacteria bacterium]
MSLKDLTRDDILRSIGLETRKTPADYVLPALGIFGAGLLVGAGLGLLLAPKSGRELRGDIRQRASQLREKLPAGTREQPQA